MKMRFLIYVVKALLKDFTWHWSKLLLKLLKRNVEMANSHEMRACKANFHGFKAKLCQVERNKRVRAIFCQF